MHRWRRVSSWLDIGDRDVEIGPQRAGDEIGELREGQWLVMHNDDRHRPDVRTVIERMAALIAAHAALFAGERPIETP